LGINDEHFMSIIFNWVEKAGDSDSAHLLIGRIVLRIHVCNELAPGNPGRKPVSYTFK